MTGTNLHSPVAPDGALTGITLPAGVTLSAVPWDDAESARLRTIQQAEIAVRYADPDADEAPTTSDIGRPPSADEIVVSLLLRVDGVPVGCAALRDVSGLSDEIGGFHAPGTGEVKRVFVSAEHRGRGGRLPHRTGVGEHGDVGALAEHRRLPERDHLVVGRPFPADAVEHRVLDEHHRIVGSDCVLEHALGVSRGARCEHDETGEVHQ